MDSEDLTPSRSFEPADLVGAVFAEQFLVTRLVSTGANTAIYDATDEHSGRGVTLKLIRPKLSSSPSFRSRFDHTMRSVAALSHPNIAAIYDWGMAPVGDTSTAYVVNEQLTGGSLRDLFDRGRRLSPSQALAVGLDVCRALDYAHRRGLVHAELNPSKIVFGDDRRLRVVDFGLARLLGAATWPQPDSIPTHVAWYSAPEQGMGGAVDGRADVYALCLSLHEAVTGTLPFKSDSTVAALAARVGKLMPVSADLGPLASVLERAGRPDAEDRSTAAEFGKALLQAASKLPRPEPLPLLSSGLFDTPVDRLRSPDDPTGGVIRPAPASDPEPLVVVPLDEPATDPAVDPEPGAGTAEGPAVDADHDLPDEIPTGRGADQLVILPADADDGAGRVRAGETTVLPTLATEPESLPHRHRGVPWRLLLGVLVLAALAGLVVLAMQLFQRPSYPVPDLVGTPEAEARNLVSANGWEIEVQSERSDDVPVIGQVVRTAPAAGVSLAEGEPFLIVVSQGPLLRELPESAGVAVAEARAALEARQLGVETVDQFDEVIPPGIVISWAVPGDPTLVAGAMVEPQTPVQLVVSAGPVPRIVPNVIGMTSVQAQAELEAVQLGYLLGDQVFSDDISLGSVVAQSVAEGTEVGRGFEIAVTLSKGPDLVVFPDISAATTYEEAAAILREAGFEPVLVFGDAQGAVQSYELGGETPTLGNTYRRGAVVEITAL